MKNLLLITIATMLILGACKPDEKKEPEVHYSYLSAEQRNKTPYFNNPAFDTLTFLSNKGDTLIFAKLKTDSFFIMTGGRPFPDHPGIYTYHQTLRNTYQTLKGNGKFEVRHVLNDGNTQDAVLVSFNNLTFGYHDRHIGSKTFRDYLGDITINNKLYSETLFAGHLGDTSIAISYINLNYGAFYFNVNTSKTSYLLFK